MQTTIDQIPASGALPENYQEVLSWKLTGKPMRVIALNVVGVIFFFIFGMIFSSIAFGLGKMPSVGNFRVGLVEISLVIAGILIASILHELTHGLAILAIGFKVRHTQQDAESRLLKSENLQFDISNGNDDSYCKCYQPVFSS